LIEACIEYLRRTSPLELIAAGLAIAYVLVAIRASPWCWPLAFMSSALYVYVFTGARLYMDGLLNVFFAAMAVYGWYQWRHGGPDRSALPISHASLRVHVAVLSVVVALTLVSGMLLGRYTNQAWPYVDSFIAWASVATTWLAARKFLENWIYWVVIDALAVPVYVNRNLHSTAVLFGMYVALAIVGWASWRREYRLQGRLA
jgi:nicotinamide mononucleotide transporter